MCASLYQTRHRQKRAARARMFKFFFFMILLGVAAVIGFRFGARDVIANEAALKSKIQTLENDTSRLQAELETLAAQKDAMSRELATARSDYQRDVPVGPAKELSVLVQQRLDDKVPETRLREIISRAPSDKSCKSAIVKRFQPATGDSIGGSAAITFEDGAVKLVGKGARARDEGGNPVSWFDPSQDLLITLTLADGKEVELNGALPLDHGWVFGNTEYHLNLAEGSRSFVQARLERCKFP